MRVRIMGCFFPRLLRLAGRDNALLCSTDGRHCGAYVWSHYNYHPFGCDADGCQTALSLESELIRDYLTGIAATKRIYDLFTTLFAWTDISRYKATGCGRFVPPLGLNFAIQLARMKENRDHTGFLLRSGSSLSDPWLPLRKCRLGVTSAANLRHFVACFSLGFK